MYNLCMNEKYKRTFTLTNNLFDTTDMLKLSSVLDLSQEISGNHADVLGCGFNEFIAKKYIWVITRNYIEFLKPIQYMKSITLETYPTKQRFVEYPREVKFYDEKGELLCVSKSIWMVLNLNDFAVETPALFDGLDLDSIEPYFEGRVRKLPIESREKLNFLKEVEVTYSMLDHNGHMNNTHYLDWFLDIYKTQNIQTVQVEYVKQSFLGDKLWLYGLKNGNLISLYGYRQDELRFYMQVRIEDLVNEN